MAKKKYIVALEQEERKELESITTKGKSPAYRVNHARILLKAGLFPCLCVMLYYELKQANNLSRRCSKLANP